MASELAKAYVQIIPTSQGLGGKLESLLGGEATSAGMSAGSKMSSAFGGAFKAGLGITTAAFSTAIAGASALTGAIINGSKETAAYGDNVDKLSQKIGISAEAFQEWDYVFSQNGTDISTRRSARRRTIPRFLYTRVK